MKKKEKKCELLAPAGGPAQYMAAVENGADAVYLGGKNFNARIHAGNFTLKEMESAVDYGHLRGVKTYVTMNTLLRDEELKEAVDYAALLYQIGVDALIIQDLGLGYLVRQAMPDFELHLSTQGSVYDREGVLAAARLGYRRVVLARELSLSEIRDACSQDQAEIEVFVHGALCMCYSGQCQLSRFIGGRSGNRGGCAQPCRLPYQYTDLAGKPVACGPHPLSPKDLCLVEELGALVEAGAASLKIEGRMKSPEYVAVVTSVYRKYLDQYLRDGTYTVSEEDWRDLNQIFNRGGFTKAYFYHDPGRKLMCETLPKHQGVPVAKVQRQRSSGKFTRQQGGFLIDVVPFADGVKEPLQLGDGVEIHGKKLSGNVITYLQPQKNGILRIGDFKEQVEPGNVVYRITSRELMERAEKTFANLTFEEGKFGRKLPVKAVFRGGINRPSELEVLEPVSFTVTEEAAAGKAPQKRATTETEIRKQLGKTGGTPFDIAALEIEMREPAFLSLQGLNLLRRKALDTLAERLLAASKRPVVNAMASEQEDASYPVSGERGELEYFFHDWRDLEKTSFDKDQGRHVTALVEAADFVENMEMILEFEKREQILICPYIPAIGKGGDCRIEALMETLLELLKMPGADGRVRRIHVGNLRWILPFAQHGEVIGEPGLNVYNRWSLQALRDLGLSAAEEPLESGESAFGWLPLMVTEHEMEPGVLTDRKGMDLRIRYSETYHKSLIQGWNDPAAMKREISNQKNNSKTIRIYV